MPKHDWKYVDTHPGGKYFKYFGCHDLRECRNCGAIQAKHANHVWGRVTGYYWEPKVGRCKPKKLLRKQINEVL